MNTFRSDISNNEFPISESVLGKTISLSVLALIQQDHSKFTVDSYLSINELNYYNEQYISNYLSNEIGELSKLDKTVLSAIANKSTLSDKIDADNDNPPTTGQRIADKVASFGGSWTFIITFGTFIFVWILVNVFWFLNKGFDAYPFILLNLILSCLAAMQAPVIMMSQNRQEEKDRERAGNDYMVNLKSELEIRFLHEKIDHMLMLQQQDFLEIKGMQQSMLNTLNNLSDKK